MSKVQQKTKTATKTTKTKAMRPGELGERAAADAVWQAMSEAERMRAVAAAMKSTTTANGVLTAAQLEERAAREVARPAIEYIGGGAPTDALRDVYDDLEVIGLAIKAKGESPGYEDEELMRIWGVLARVQLRLSDTTEKMDAESDGRRPTFVGLQAVKP